MLFRSKKTLLFKNDREGFIAQLARDIQMLEKESAKHGLKPCVRLNGTSDLPFENLGIIERFPHIQFYDYTKNLLRMLPNAKAQQLPNYHLTFSRSESNESACQIVAGMKKNVAVVFNSKNFPDTYYGLPVVNGDETDLRFLDPQGCIVALYAKGKARYDTSGFVVSAAGKQ